MDSTEYLGGVELLGSWTLWKKFKESWPHFSNKILPEWLEEIEVATRSKAIISLRQQAEVNTAAAKFLVEDTTKRKPGRPSKDMVIREARIQANAEKQAQEDFNRVYGNDE